MALYRKELQSGIFYNHLQTNRFKTNYFSINFITPLEKESAVYYTILPLLLQRGCQQYPDRRKLVRRLEELYGTGFSVRNTKMGDMQVISFSCNMLDDAYLPQGETVSLLQEVLHLMRQVLTEPLLENDAFLPSYTEGEIRNATDNKRAIINNKMAYAYERCILQMFADEAYSIPADGLLEQYENILPERLISYYRRMMNHARVEMFFVGREASSVVEEMAQPVFSDVMRAYVPIPDTRAAVRVVAPQEHVIQETTHAEQGKLVMGYRTGITMQSQDAVAFSLFNEIFGGSASSKLFMNVREKKSLCYSCSSTGDLLKGTLFVLAGIDNKNFDVTVKEIKKQLDNIEQGDISEDELHCAKQSLIGAYRSMPDSAEAMKTWYLRRILCHALEEPETVVQKIRLLEKEDVITIAKQIQLDTVYFLKGEENGHCNEADQKQGVFYE